MGLNDYYGQLSTATSSGTCQIVSPNTQLLLTEQGRVASIQNGSAVFAQFDATGEEVARPHAFYLQEERPVTQKQPSHAMIWPATLQAESATHST